MNGTTVHVIFKGKLLTVLLLTRNIHWIFLMSFKEENLIFWRSGQYTNLYNILLILKSYMLLVKLLHLIINVLINAPSIYYFQIFKHLMQMIINICKMKPNSVLKANAIKTRLFFSVTLQIENVTLDTVKYVENSKITWCLPF